MTDRKPPRALPRIVGARPGDGTTLTVNTRDAKRTVRSERTVQPWLLTSRESLPAGSPNPAARTELTGSHPLRYIVEFTSWPDLWSCVRAFVEAESSLRGQRVASFAELPHLYLLPDPVDQWLVRSGSAFFSDLAADAVTRCTLSIGTEAGRPYLSGSERPEGALRIVSVAEKNGEVTTFRSRKKDERALLQDLIRFIAELDPDMICGGDVQSLVLPYIEKRLEIHGLEPTLGRENTPLRPHPITYLRAARDVPGRSVFDLMDIVQNAELLKICGYRRSVRQVLKDDTLAIGPLLRSIEREDVPRRVKLMGQIVSETLECLLPLFQSTPLTPTHALRASAATRLEASIVRDCLDDGVSLPVAGPSPHAPLPAEASYRTGVYTTTVEIALARRSFAVLASLPAETLTRLEPPLGPQLRILHRDIGAVVASGPAPAMPIASELHSTAIGTVDLLTSRQSRFLDDQIARDLTRSLRRVNHEAEEALSLQNVRVLQRTGETLVCQLPDNARHSLSTFWEKIQRQLPHGLQAILLDRFDECVSLGPRLFALRADGRMTMHRKARIPRFFEPFLRDFFARALDHSLRRDWAGLRELYIGTLRRIQQHSWHVLDFARQETLAENMDRYDELVRAGKRHPSAAYEALRTTDPSARAGTIVRYYITGSKKEVTQAENCKLSDMWDSADPDENTEYYLDRLAQCVDRFRILFEPGSFARLFGSEDLFGFDPSTIVTVEQESDPGSETLDSRPERDTGITLDL